MIKKWIDRRRELAKKNGNPSGFEQGYTDGFNDAMAIAHDMALALNLVPHQEMKPYTVSVRIQKQCRDALAKYAEWRRQYDTP